MIYKLPYGKAIGLNENLACTYEDRLNSMRKDVEAIYRCSYTQNDFTTPKQEYQFWLNSLNFQVVAMHTDARCSSNKQLNDFARQIARFYNELQTEDPTAIHNAFEHLLWEAGM